MSSTLMLKVTKLVFSVQLSKYLENSLIWKLHAYKMSLYMYTVIHIHTLFRLLPSCVALELINWTFSL